MPLEVRALKKIRSLVRKYREGKLDFDWRKIAVCVVDALSVYNPS